MNSDNKHKKINVSSLCQKDQPLLICVIADDTPAGCIASIRNAIYDGADGFMLDLAKLDDKYHTVKDIREIVDYAQNKPVISFDYRYARVEVAKSDEELVNSQIIAAKAGVDMCDIMGDIFDPSPLMLTHKNEIIKKQKRLVDKIHSLGGEVLMSSHIWGMMKPEQTIEHARALKSRGADMIKIAMCAIAEDDLFETLRTTALMRRELDFPFLHVCMGQYGKIHRVISGMLGSSMLLCVQQYTNISHRDQPLLRATRDVLNNLDWNNAKDPLIGAIEPDILVKK
jgi:3-dehydroquinate dehydratase type I